jgi:hypothetical protein
VLLGEHLPAWNFHGHPKAAGRIVGAGVLTPGTSLGTYLPKDAYDSVINDLTSNEA